MRLDPQQIAPYLSAYLTGGWQRDRFEFNSVDVEPGRASAIVQLPEHFTPADGLFHLTVPTVFIVVSQLAIIYGCWDHDLPRKPGEIYVRGISLECRRPVRTSQEIAFTLTLDRKRAVTEGTFYSGAISVADDSFIGRGRFVLPLPSSAVR